MPTLRSQLIRLAHENPELRSDLLNILTAEQEVEAGTERVAEHDITSTSGATKDFITWVFLREARGEKKPYSDAEFTQALKRLGIHIKESTGTRKSGNLTKDEIVRPDKHKCSNENNAEACETYHGEAGTVVEVTSTGLVVRFLVRGGRQDVEFEGKKAGKATGLYRHSTEDAMDALSKSVMVEVVYVKDKSAPPKVDKLRQEEVDAYLQRQKGRDSRYYTGPVSSAAKNKAGQVYLSFKPQQRAGWANINPSKGQVLYIGKMGKRPGGWQSDLEDWTWDPSEEELLGRFDELGA